MSKGITDSKSTLGNVCQLILERMKRVIDSLSLLTWSPHPWHSFSCRVFYLSHKYHPCPHHGKRKLEQEITTGWKEEPLKGLLSQIWLNYLPVQVHNPRFYHKDVQPKDHITDKEEREFPFLCFRCSRPDIVTQQPKYCVFRRLHRCYLLVHRLL